MSSAFLPEAKFSIPRDGGELAYFRYGQPGVKNILAIHGVTSSNRAWQLFARTAVKNGFTVYAVDLRGRGDSNSITGPFGMRTHAQDIVSVLDHIGIKSCDVIGHSMGAFVVAAMCGLVPERLTKVIFVDGGVPLALPPGFTVEQIMPLVLGPALERLAKTFTNNEDYRNYWKAQPAFVKGWTEAMNEYVDYDLRGSAGDLHASTLAEAVAEDSRDLFGDDLIVNSLKNLDREVLMIRAVRGLQNEELPLYPEPIIKLALENYPRINLVTLDDTNHYDILLEQTGADRVFECVYGKGK
mgnify:FL=1